MIGGNVRKALGIAGIRQLIEIHNLHVTPGRKQVPNKIRPDKARTTRYENLHAVSPFCSNPPVMSNRCPVLFAVSRMSRRSPAPWAFVCSGFRDHVRSTQ